MDDRKIIGLFLERSERAIVEVSKKYGALCRHIAMGILTRETDVEECINDAYMALWNTIPPEQPRSLRAYLMAILRNIACKRLSYQNAAQRDSRLEDSLEELRNILPDLSQEERRLDSAVIRDTLNRFLHSLHKKDRFLFLRRYYYLDTCREIAGMTGMKESAVSSRLNRLRDKLKLLLEKEGIYL